VSSDAPRSSGVERTYRPFKKALLVRLTETFSHLSSFEAALWRAAAYRSPRASARKRYALVARYVHRALRIFASSSRTARGTVSSYDHHQRGTAEASQLEQDNQNTQCKYSSLVTGSPFMEVSSFAPRRS
jgi:hypothetical protein